MTSPDAQPDRLFRLLARGDPESGRFSITSVDSAKWSHIVTKRTKNDGTMLTLYSKPSSKPSAFARERKVSDRPGVVESTQAIAGVFDVTDHDGKPLAVLRKDTLQSVLRTTWRIEFPDGKEVVGRESNPVGIVLRRLLMLAELLVDIPIRLSSVFAFRADDRVYFSLRSTSDTSDGIEVIVSADADDRLALLQAALTRSR